MTTRTSTIKWTRELIRDGFKRFFSENNRYPTSTEIDTCVYLPSSRQLQRRFGGLPNLRAELRLKGQLDFTKGAYSSSRAKTINVRAHGLEKKVYDYLVARFSKPFVHREFFFTDDKRTRTDFFVYYDKGNFAVDAFYPKDRHNFIGCLNSKMRTYNTSFLVQYPIIFLMMNEDIDEEEIRDILINKKNKLKENQMVMTFEQLKKYCREKRPLSLP